MRRVRLTAAGLVQGVFFRASARDEARRLGVTGWVGNAPDGTVVAEVQGDDSTVEQMVQFVRRGPGQARVERLAVEDIAVVDSERGFGVR